jgi:hypothetical protein
MLRAVTAAVCVFSLACASQPLPAGSDGAPDAAASSKRRAVAHPGLPPLIEDLERRSFEWFRDTSNATNGLVPDRWPTPSFSSVAAVGYGLTAWGIGAERGYVTREEAAERVVTTLRFFRNAPQGEAERGMTGHRGFFYHFLDMQTGERFENVELSTIDTTLFLAGALFCQSYFDRDTPVEAEIRRLAEEIYQRVEWDWAMQSPPLVSMGWKPGEGLSTWSWRGYDEAMILYILAMGSPTHPVPATAWNEWTKTYRWLSYYGYEHVNFAPLFGHQFSQGYVDFRGIQDAYMREKGIDYFENARRATLSQRAYAIDNPNGWEGYGENVWGLTACDGPLDVELPHGGTMRRYFTYAARGAAATEVRDDGTIAPYAAGSSIAMTPAESIAALEEMHRRYGSLIYGRYGFFAFNPTFRYDVKPQHGRIDPELGWVDGDYLGIEVGPQLIMIENYRSGLVWDTMRRNPHIAKGLRAAGFAGGWLEGAP